MRLVLADKVALLVHLVPGLGGEDVVDVLDAVVAPDGVVHALPAHGLEGVVDVGQGHPAAAVQVRQHALVGKVHVEGVGLHVLDDLAVDAAARVDDLEAAVHEAQGPDGRVDALGLGGLGVRVLVGKGAVGGDPVLGVVRLLEGVADAGVTGGEDAAAPALLDVGRVVELEVHELVHVAQHQHVRVELDDALVLGQREGRQLAPAVVEARVVAVVLALCRQQVLDALRRDAARLERRQPRLGERVGVEGDQGVFRLLLLQGEVERDQAREVGIVGDQGRPD